LPANFIIMKPELKKLEKLIGKKALRSLRERRSVLNIWRGTCPFNWFVENSRRNFLWHSMEEERKYPDLRLFDEITNPNGEIIQTGFKWVMGEGQPYLSTFVLKEEYLLKAGKIKCQN